MTLHKQIKTAFGVKMNGMTEALIVAAMVQALPADQRKNFVHTGNATVSGEAIAIVYLNRRSVFFAREAKRFGESGTQPILTLDEFKAQFGKAPEVVTAPPAEPAKAPEVKTEANKLANIPPPAAQPNKRAQA